MKNREALEQQKVVNYLEILKRQGKVIEYFAPVNENKHSKQNRQSAIIFEKQAQKMGKKAGVSDLVVIFKDKVLFLEMKRPPKKLKNGKLSYAGIKVSEYQKKFLENINKSEICVGKVAYGFEEARKIIDKLL